LPRNGGERIGYGRGRARFGEMTLPAGPGPHPVAVVLHGGFWKRIYDRRLMWGVSEDLARRGFIAWNVEYRRVGWIGSGGWPGTCEDVTAAVEFLRHFDNVDLKRVVAVGHSAGGHLAAWLAGTNDQREVKIKAACAQAGVVDFEAGDADPRCSQNIRNFLGGADPADVPDADPARMDIKVPVLCVHGRDDGIVPVAVSEAFVEKQPLAELRVFGGEDHMGHIHAANRMWQAAAQWLTAV
jgi:acetyl esterase/lipase